MKALVYECIVLTAANITLAYPGYADAHGLRVGGAWRRDGGFIQLAGFAALAFPLLNMIGRGQGVATLWIYPAALVAAWLFAFLLVNALRHWAQGVALLGITVGVIVMFIAARGR